MKPRNYKLLVSIVTILMIGLFVGQLLVVQPAQSSETMTALRNQLSSQGSDGSRIVIDGKYNGDVEPSQEVLNQIIWTHESTTVNITQVTVNKTIITVNATKFVIQNYMNTTSISVNQTTFLFFNASAMYFNFTYIQVDGFIYSLEFRQILESTWWFRLTRGLTIISEGYLRFSSDLQASNALANLDVLLYPSISTPDKVPMPAEGAARFNYTVTRDVSSVTLNDNKSGDYVPLVDSFFDIFYDLTLDGSYADEFDPAAPALENISRMSGVLRPFTNKTDATNDFDGYDLNVNFSRTINDGVAGTSYVAEGGFESTIYHENMSASFIRDAIQPSAPPVELPPRGLINMSYYNASLGLGEIAIANFLVVIEESGISIGIFDLYIFFGWDKVVFDYAFVVSITIYLLVYQLEIVFFEITIIMYLLVTELIFVLIFYEFKIEVYITQIIIKYLWITITLVFISIQVVILYIFILWIQITIKIIKKVIVPWWWWWPPWWWPIWIVFVPVPILIPKPVPAPYPVPVIIKLLDIDLINETREANQVTYQFLVRDSLGINVTGATVTLSNGTLTKNATEIGNGVYEVTFPLSDPSKSMNFTAEATIATLPKATLKFHVDHRAPVSTVTKVVNQTVTVTKTVTQTSPTNQTTSPTTSPTGQITPGFTLFSMLLASMGVVILRFWWKKQRGNAA